MFTGISKHHIPQIWDVVAPMLQKAINKSQKDYSVDDIFNFLMSDDMQLWAWLEDKKIIACCISQIVNYPQRKVCQLPYIAGSGLRRFLEAEEIIIKWAKMNDCTQLEGCARDGWLRIMQPRNWFKVWVTIRKDI